jgi:glutamate decarboxylase
MEQMQVCFYWARNGKLSDDKEINARTTEEIVQRLIPMGWMTDYAPGEHGKFFRVVVGREVRKETIEGLVRAIEVAADQLFRES